MKLEGFAFRGRGILLVTLLLMTLVAGGAVLAGCSGDSSGTESDSSAASSTNDQTVSSAEEHDESRVNQIGVDNKTGDVVSFGSWRGAELEWIILAVENDRALLVTKDIVAVHPFYDYITDTSSIMPITWEQSSVRHWLNNDFISSAFSSDYLSLVLESNVANSANLEYGTHEANNTLDKVYLLSIDEVNQYFPNDADRIAEYKWTEEDRQRDDVILMIDDDEIGIGEAIPWWLRSANYSDEISSAAVASIVTDEGSIYSRENIFLAWGVRPAVWVKVR